MATILEQIEAVQARNKRGDSGYFAPDEKIWNAKGTGFNTAVAQPSSVVSQEEREKYEGLIKANDALHVVGMGLPLGTGMGLQALTDMQIEQMERQNPSLAPKNPFTKDARNRFSTVGQVLFGYGYPTQVGIPRPTISQRIGNLFGQNNIPDPNTTMFNARGNVFTITEPRETSPFTGGGWESGDGGRGPSEGTTSFGGRESMVDNNDYSGYA